MKVILTAVISKYKYIGINDNSTKHINILIESLLDEYDWYLDVTQFGGTIQGVLNTDDITAGIDAANEIIDFDQETTIVVSVGEVNIVDSPFSKNVGTNRSIGFIKHGRHLDKLVEDDKFGVYDFTNQCWRLTHLLYIISPKGRKINLLSSEYVVINNKKYKKIDYDNDDSYYNYIKEKLNNVNIIHTRDYTYYLNNSMLHCLDGPAIKCNKKISKLKEPNSYYIDGKNYLVKDFMDNHRKKSWDLNNSRIEALTTILKKNKHMESIKSAKESREISDNINIENNNNILKTINKSIVDSREDGNYSAIYYGAMSLEIKSILTQNGYEIEMKPSGNNEIDTIISW